VNFEYEPAPPVRVASEDNIAKPARLARAPLEAGRSI